MLKRYLFIWTISFIALLFFGISGSVLASTAGNDQEAGNTGTGETLVVSPYQNPLGVSSTTSSLTYFSPYTNLTYNVPSAVKALGVDVSKWQGTIDWEAVARDGIRFAIIRAAHHNGDDTGNIVDDAYLTQNIEGAQAVGIKVGVYIYSQAITTAEAEEEAQHVLNLIHGYHIDLPVIMDVEFDSGNTGRLYNATYLTRAQRTDICQAFCDYVADHGYIPMIYCNTDMLKNYLDASRIESMANLWYANYIPKTWPVGTPYTPLYTGTFAIWQYSSSGSVAGIDGNVDCNFAFADLDELSIPFRDVSQGSWYFNAVLYAYQQHLFNGTSNTTFAPNEAMSRGMLAAVLYRLEGSPAVSGVTSFSDVKAGSWYENGVLWAEENGIVNGVGANEFSPSSDLTREQIATMLYRYSQYKGYDLTADGSLDGFSDGSRVSRFAVTAMKWAVGHGYLNGVTADTLCPGESATRAQLAAVLMRFCKDHTGTE